MTPKDNVRKKFGDYKYYIYICDVNKTILIHHYDTKNKKTISSRQLYPIR